MKILIITIISLLLSFFISCASITANENIISTLYNVACVVFSIGMGLIITFPLNGVKNIYYIQAIRSSIKKVRNKFIIVFAICTLSYIIQNFIPKIKIYTVYLNLFISNFTWIFFVCAIAYFIVNFINVQNLKYNIFDRVLEEENKK